MLKREGRIDHVLLPLRIHPSVQQGIQQKRHGKKPPEQAAKREKFSNFTLSDESIQGHPSHAPEDSKHVGN